jgi:hypothetical protein
MCELDREIDELRSEVERSPQDPFLRCNLAHLLVSVGDHREALVHLASAMFHASGPMAAGCVASAVRYVTDDFSRLWQLPCGGPELHLVSA